MAIRDSAGVQVVESGRPSASGWRVVTPPRYLLGWQSGEPTFTWIQSGRILADGGALVGDFGAGAIFRIGPEGSVSATWGRKGEGPGEYQALDAILAHADTILVSDSRLRRITPLSETGDVLATRRLTGNFLHQVSWIANDGRLLLIPVEGYAGTVDTRWEWVFERQPIIAASLEGGSIDTLANLPHLRRWYGTRGASPGPIPVKGRTGGFAGGFAWSRSYKPEVRWYDFAGRLVQIARWEEDAAPVTTDWKSAVAASYEESFRSAGAEEAMITARLAELEEVFDQHDGPLPYWDVFHVDRKGNVWQREYSLPAEHSPKWRIIRRDGRLAGWIELPGVVSILDITEDRVLAVQLNELDVPAVAMFELVKDR